MNEKFDKNDNLIYKRYLNDYEYWWEYDENNNEIHFNSSKGSEYWKKYDKNNRIIYCKRHDGREDYYYKYDKLGRNIETITKNTYK